MKLRAIYLCCLLFLSISLTAQKNQSKEAMKLIYVMDPQCGWCYGNSKNISELTEKVKGKLATELLVGGMWIGPQAPKGGENLSNFIEAHSPRMEKTTGAFVSPAFYALTKDASYTFSSMDACAAIVAVKTIAPEKTFPFAGKVQKAQFADAHRYDQLETYTTILKELNIDINAFKALWKTPENLKATQQDFQSAQQLVSGFPGLLLYKDGKYQLLASGYFNLEQVWKNIEQQLP